MTIEPGLGRRIQVAGPRDHSHSSADAFVGPRRLNPSPKRYAKPDPHHVRPRAAIIAVERWGPTRSETALRAFCNVLRFHGVVTIEPPPVRSAGDQFLLTPSRELTLTGELAAPAAAWRRPQREFLN